MFKLRKRSREQCENWLFLWRKFAVHVLYVKKKKNPILTINAAECDEVPLL